LGNTSIPAPFVVDNQNNNIGFDRSGGENPFIRSFSPVISFSEEDDDTPLSPAISSVHDIMPAIVGQEKAPHASYDLYAYHKHAPKNIARKGSDLLSVSPGANHPTGGSGIVVKTGRPVALNVVGDGENPNSNIHHDGLSDAVVPSHDAIGSRIDDTLVSKSKVSLDCFRDTTRSIFSFMLTISLNTFHHFE